MDRKEGVSGTAGGRAADIVIQIHRYRCHSGYRYTDTDAIVDTDTQIQMP